jgi:DNA (cytosine-5)-methyltransferase 1
MVGILGNVQGKLTYISLFSSAGIGCYGFKQEGFVCVATNELSERRLAVQKYNAKCKYDSGYILGDITADEVKQKLFSEIEFWRKREGLCEIDVVIATPPCQGMSVANHKKTDNEIVRNSLIVESIKIIADICPKIFIFENVPLFMKTICSDIDGEERPIGEAIERNLGNSYSIYSKVLNFKDYGACSSRSRTLVIAVRKDMADHFSPIELFPAVKAERTLRETIGAMKSLTMFGEIDAVDIYHNFRVYPENMRTWISALAEGKSAFENEDINRVPHRVVNGKIVVNQRKNGDKYRRQFWDKVGPCVHTRNDQLASQNTIHPADDRVFSIRELMCMMTVPDDFRWTDIDINELNALSYAEKRAFLKKHEMNIRQSLGEAVPTEIFHSIAARIRIELTKPRLKDSDIKNIINGYGITDAQSLVSFVRNNPMKLAFTALSRVVELANAKRAEHEAYFTNKILITEMLKSLPDFSGDTVRILEPSVGAGNFIPFIIKLFERKREIQITVFDIDAVAIAVLRELLNYVDIPSNVHIDYVCADFLLYPVFKHYDLAIGNPPFSKSARGKLLDSYRENANNKKASNTSAFFIEKAIEVSDYVAMVMPKFLLNTPEFRDTREMLSQYAVDSIIDFGESGFGGVLIETVAVCVNPNAKPGQTAIVSVTDNERGIKPQKYICDNMFPYWLIYRDSQFDRICCRLRFNVFEVFRDRQLTNNLMNGCTSGVRVIKSRNISNDGSAIVDIEGYDAYVPHDVAKTLSVYKYLNNDSVYLAPNMTYKPRLIRKPQNVLVNGSAAILSLKAGQSPLSDDEISYFASDEYRAFYKTARNRQTRSLNIDANAVFFFGRLIDVGGESGAVG